MIVQMHRSHVYVLNLEQDEIVSISHSDVLGRTCAVKVGQAN